MTFDVNDLLEFGGHHMTGILTNFENTEVKEVNYTFASYS